MLHDLGLTPAYCSARERFEVDGANVARDFHRSHGTAQRDIGTVWTAIAPQTTPRIPQHIHPVVALVDGRVEMDVLGLAYAEYSAAEREAVVHAHPRTEHFKEDIIQAFYDGIKHQTRNDIRQRQGRRARGQGCRFQARQFLQRNSRIGM
jgi:hypothetical protein